MRKFTQMLSQLQGGFKTRAARNASSRRSRRSTARLALRAELLEGRRVLAAGQISFELANYDVNEQAGYRTVNVQRVGGSDGTLTVDFATSDGTATVASMDYVAASGSLTFANGETSKVITVQVATDTLVEASETFAISLNGPAGVVGANATAMISINDTPTISAITAPFTPIGTATSPIAFMIGDAETLPENLVLSVLSSNPTLVPNSNLVLGGSGVNRTVTATPAVGLTGTAQISLIATDGGGATAVRNFTLNVGSTAASPFPFASMTLPDVVLTADESHTLNYTISDAAWVTTVSRSNTTLFNTPATGSTSDLRTQPNSGGTARTLRIRPKDNSTSVGLYGTSTVTLGFTGVGAPASQTFNVRVNPRSVADNNLLAIPGTTNTFDVLANDVAPLPGHTFNITSVSSPSNGTLTIAPGGRSLLYTPTDLTKDSDAFTYTVTISSSDAFNGFTFTGNAYVKIGGYVVVDSPTAAQHIDLDFDYVGGEWVQRIRTDANIIGSLESGNRSPTILDSDEGVLFFDPSTKIPRNANAILDPLGVPAGADVWYGPTSGNGNKVFLGIATESTSGIDSYVPVGDSRATSNAAWVAVKLVGFNGPGHFAAFNGSDLAFDTFDGLNSPTDATSGGNVSDTFWTFAGSHAHPGWYFTAAGRYELTFETTVRVGGQIVTSPPTTFTFDVDRMGGNARLRENPPTLTNDAITIAEDSGAVTIPVLANDTSNPDGFEVLTVTAVGSAANGVATVAADGRSVRYTPNSNFFGNDSFTYTVSDEHGGVASAPVNVTVNAENDAPTISNIANRFVLEGNSTGAIPFTIGDIETAAGDLVVTATSSNQTVIPSSSIVLEGSGTNRTISLTSIANQIGTSEITVTVTDANGGQASDTFVLTVGDLVRATFDRSAVIVNATNPTDVRLADIDNDGDLDVLFAKYITSISILPNNGDGTFGTEIALSALTVSDIHVADVNGDNLLDIVSSVYVDSTYAETAIAVWRNLSGGNFSGRELVESTRTTAFVGLTGVGDVDGDGLKDLVLSNNGLSWSRNQGGGTFGTGVTISTGGINYSSALHDIDQDGDLDIAQAILLNDEFKLQVFRNSGTGVPSFVAEDVASFDSNAIRNIAIGDTNQDGFLDIHLLRGGSNSDIVAMHGTSTGAFLASVVLGSGPNLSDLEIGDIDGDGRPDLALTAQQQNQVHFAQNLGSGVFTELQEFTHDGSSLNPYPDSVAIGDIDRDGRNDLVFSERFGTGIAWSRNRSEEDLTALAPPEPRTYLNGYPMTFDVFLGFNVQVKTSGGSPTLPVTIGSQVVQVPYIGQPNANTLRFRYQVQATDVDLDGIQVATALVLNGATFADVHGRPIDASFLQFATVNSSGILVNGGAPYVTGITRLDPNPAASGTIRFGVTFSQAVTGVTIDDFRIDANGPTGAAVISVTGSGSSYVVTSSIGSGDGTLRLRVLDDDSIVDANSYQLGGVGVGNGEFSYGQGYTIRSSTATPAFNNVITDGHLDVVLQVLPGDWYGFWYGEGWWETTDTVISAGPDARVTRPSDATWDFLGAAAGEPVWVFPETFSLTTPWPGVGAYFNNAGDFASYFESDPRVNGTAPWIKMQLLGVRGPEGGDFSLYQSGITAPNVFMSSANGIGPEDAAWLPNLDHVHYNWVFSKPGLYQVDIAASGYIDANQSGAYEPGVDPLSESQIITLHFGVELKAQDDSFTVSGNQLLWGSVTLNDQSEWGVGATTASVGSTTTKGALSLQPNGSFTYQPSVAFDGTDSFTYRLTNPGGSFTTATVTITGSTRPDFDAVLTKGHADIGINFEEDAWDLHIHQHESDTEYEPDEAMLYVGRDAMQTRSGDHANSAHDFLGAPVGSTLFVLPEVENTNLLFLGIGGEELGEGLLEGDVATLRLASVSGPGHFSIWQAGLTATTPKLIMATSDGIDAADAYEVEAGSHAHANFAFTKQGFYEVTFVASGVDADGNATDSGQVTYHIFVTDGLVPFATPNLLPPGLGVAANSVVADFNGDGKLDLVTSGSGVEQLGYRQGLGGGNFLPEQGLNLGLGQRSGGLNTIDYDGDGDIDFVAAEAPSSSSTSTQLVLYRNNGSASFTRSVLLSSSAGPSFFQLFPGDLNGDGRVDLVYRKGATAAVYALQQADGSFGAEVTLTTSPSNAFPRLGDMDNDGDLDVVVGNFAASGSGTIDVFRNNGSGSFIASPSFNGGVSPNVLRLTDMNGDGRVDVVSSTSTAGSRAGYFPQLADGTFGARVNVMTAITSLNSIEVADINGDAIPDIIAGVNLSGNVLAWSPGLGGGNYGSPILMDPAQGSSFGVFARDLDGDSHLDLISMGNLVSRPSPIVVHINKTGENPMVLLPPRALRYVNGDQLSMGVYFGFPVTVTGTPRIALQIGASTVYANYVSGSGTATLRFRYTVGSTDMDLDGVQLLSNLIDLNGGTITNPIGGAGVLEFPNMTFSGVTVNGRGPLVQGITRLDPSRSTNAGTVRFQLQFAEPVTGVEESDLNVVMNAGDLSGASVLSVSGSGTVYEVTVGTGTGSGTLGLGVKESASILDLNGDVLAKGFVGGEVYTIRPEAIGDIDTFYTNGHSDYRAVYANGEFSQILDLDPGVLPLTEYQSDSVYTYADSSALVNRPVGTTFDFLGVAAGQPLYVLPAVQNPALPYIGWGDRIDRGVFASYLPADSRVTSAASYVKLEMVGMRSSSGGDFSVYQIVVGPNTPRVWMATSDGISSNDAIYLSVGGHLHREVTFSKPGIYEVDVVISGFLDANGNGTYDPIIDQYTESGIKTMVFNVDTLGAKNDSFVFDGKSTLRGNVDFNDTWNPALGTETLSIHTQPTKGALTIDPSGAFTYVPSPNFSGTDSFVYRVTNSRGGFTSGTVTIAQASDPDFVFTYKEGHGDIEIEENGGILDVGLHVDDESGGSEFAPSEVLLYVGSEATEQRTAGFNHPQYDFLGVASNANFFVLPQDDEPGLPFLGVGTEELPSGLFAGNTVRLRLASVSGPGHYSMWTIDSAGVPQVKMSTVDGVSEVDAFVVSAPSHAHMNQAFSKLGRYQVTFIAEGILASDGQTLQSVPVTYHYQVGNTVDAIDVQNGLTQRSFIRNVDLLFGEEDSLNEMLLAGRVQVTRMDLNGENPSTPLVTPLLSVVNNKVRLDFGAQGIGGNRNTNAGDGYYRVGVDIDGDGIADSFHHFYRLLGDANGDRKVDAADRQLVMGSSGTRNRNADMNGDGVVNSVDFTLTSRAIGKKLKDGLLVDD